MNSSALESRDHGLEITTLENVDHKYHNLVISCAFSFRALSETVIVFVEKAKRHRPHSDGTLEIYGTAATARAFCPSREVSSSDRGRS